MQYKLARVDHKQLAHTYLSFNFPTTNWFDSDPLPKLYTYVNQFDATNHVIHNACSRELLSCTTIYIYYIKINVDILRSTSDNEPLSQVNI
jgi:hypothetical protein